MLHRSETEAAWPEDKPDAHDDTKVKKMDHTRSCSTQGVRRQHKDLLQGECVIHEDLQSRICR